MANYKLITHESVGQTSEIMFTASATNTVVSSITAKDGSGQTAEVLVQKSGASGAIEMAEVSLTSNAGFQIIDVAFALEAGDKVFIRATRGGMKFIMSYVEETDVPSTTNLGGLGNVDTAGVADGQSLVYNGSSSQWEPVTVTSGTGSGAEELDELSDVDITSAISGHILRHNGSKFINVAPTTAMIQESTGSKYLDITNEQKLNNITVTGNVDLDQMETDIANVATMHYTTSDFDTDFSNKTTADLAEDSDNKYYTEARVSANADVVANSNKVGITNAQAADIAANNTKISFTEAAAVTANSNKVSADGSVATHSDVTSAGSGAIITDNERTKLNGIDTSATANDTDANLKNRGNHTGTQLSSTISDFTAEVENVIANQIGNTGDLVEGSNLYYTNARVDARIGLAKIEDLDEVSSTAPSTGQVLKWSGSEWAPAADNTSSGSGGVVDSVNGISQANVVLDTDNISDESATNKYTTAGDITKLSGIANGATANDTDINLKNRGNHTGQQTASTISDFDTASAAVIAAANLQSLNNVDGSPTTGEFLKWTGSQWETDSVSPGGGAVDSVNTQTGVVVLDADDIDDASTTHKFVAQDDLDKLGHISVSQAVDLDAMESSISTNNAGLLAALSTAQAATTAVSSHTGSIANHADVGFQYNSTTGQPLSRPDGAFIRWDLSNGRWEDVDITIHDGNYNTLTNVPADFTPSAHTHVAADITDFNTAVDARIPVGNTTVHDADSSLPFNGTAGAGAEKMDFTTTNLTMVAGRVYKLGSTGWEQASNLDSSMETLLAICPFGDNDGTNMILKGAVRVDISTASASIGDPVYLSTGSKFTLTAPTSNAYVMKMGYVLDASGKIFFDPDSTSIKVQ